jgi:Kelch motif protein
MDDMTRFEERFEERLRALARTGVQSVDSAAVARTVAIGHPRSVAKWPAQRRLLQEMHRTRQRYMSRTAFAAAAIVALVALGGAIAALGGPSPTPSVHPSSSLPAVVPSSPTPSATAPSAPGFPRSSGVWIATGTMGTPRYGHTAVRLLDGRVLVVGGGNGDETDLTAELYDPNSGTWSATGSMVRPHADGFPATLLRDGRVLVGNADDAEVYDPVSGTWTVTGRMLGGYGHSATLLADGKVLVVHNGDRAELYDPATGTWTATGKMTTWGDYRGAVLLRDGRALVTGGTAKSAELYDPATGSWAASANMKTWRNPIALSLLPDGKVLVTGGDGSEWTPPDLYDPVTGTWTPTGDFARPGAHYGSETLLSDGMVLVAGMGIDSPVAVNLDAELYDAGTGSWTTTGSMLREHSAGPLTLLLDGTVLVAGGVDCSDRPAAPSVCIATGSAELYVPAGLSPPAGLPAAPSPTPIQTATPTSTPTPIPPAAGPVPPGARPWEVMVVNKTSEPATLFVAEENEQGLLGRLIGSVTPNVVPPGATVKVTFLLPANGVDGWSIFVNAGPDNGALLAGADVPLAGEIRITADGQVGWLSP